jgi:hypothetical protein
LDLRRVRLVYIVALKVVHVHRRRPLSSLCVVTARGAERRACLVARRAAGRVPRWLGRSWPQRGVDTPSLASRSRCPPLAVCPLCAAEALSRRSPCQPARPPTPRYRPCCTAVPRRLAHVGRLQFVRPAPRHRQRQQFSPSYFALSPYHGPVAPIRRLATTSSQFPARTALVSSPLAEQPAPLVIVSPPAPF